MYSTKCCYHKTCLILILLNKFYQSFHTLSIRHKNRLANDKFENEIFVLAATVFTLKKNNSYLFKFLIQNLKNKHVLMMLMLHIDFSFASHSSKFENLNLGPKIQRIK
jgi:hypothetical protein